MPSNRDSDEFVDRLVTRDLSSDTAVPFDKDDIDFIQRNPEVLDKLADPHEFKKRYLYALFGIATVMAVVAKTLEYTKVLDSYEVADDLLTTVMFTISMELLGATLVAFVMELLLDRRIKHNNAIIRRLRQ
ncbi:hypothetical protein GCM10009624_25710 [Gordonia sinesedis]